MTSDHRAIVKMWPHRELGTEDVDIYVTLSDGFSYVTTSITPERLLFYLRDDSGHTGMPFPYSEYIGDPSMIVVSRLDMALFASITREMLRDSTFERFYQRCSESRHF